MNDNDYTIRPMTRAEIDIMVKWADREGWNPGIHDAECYSLTDPRGFLVGLLDGRPIATISAIRYGDSFGFVGFYIVAPEHRGKGFGFRIWNAGLEYLAGRTVGLDGVAARQQHYNRIGFNLAYRNTRFAGHGGGSAPDTPEVVPLATFPFATVDAYEQPFFPAPRTAFLNAWVDQPDTYALGFRHRGELAGYGVMRRCSNGYKIGPLHVNSAEIADTLLTSFCAKVAPAEPVFLDVPEVNEGAMQLVQRHRMTAVFETARMYRGKAPVLPVDRIYGVTSFEVG